MNLNPLSWNGALDFRRIPGSTVQSSAIAAAVVGDANGRAEAVERDRAVSVTYKVRPPLLFLNVGLPVLWFAFSAYAVTAALAGGGELMDLNGFSLLGIVLGPLLMVAVGAFNHWTWRNRARERVKSLASRSAV